MRTDLIAPQLMGMPHLPAILRPRSVGFSVNAVDPGDDYIRVDPANLALAGALTNVTWHPLTRRYIDEFWPVVEQQAAFCSFKVYPGQFSGTTLTVNTAAPVTWGMSTAGLGVDVNQSQTLGFYSGTRITPNTVLYSTVPRGTWSGNNSDNRWVITEAINMTSGNWAAPTFAANSSITRGSLAIGNAGLTFGNCQAVAADRLYNTFHYNTNENANYYQYTTDANGYAAQSLYGAQVTQIGQATYDQIQPLAVDNATLVLCDHRSISANRQSFDASMFSQNMNSGSYWSSSWATLYGGFYAAGIGGKNRLVLMHSSGGVRFGVYDVSSGAIPTQLSFSAAIGLTGVPVMVHRLNDSQFLLFHYITGTQLGVRVCTIASDNTVAMGGVTALGDPGFSVNGWVSWNWCVNMPGNRVFCFFGGNNTTDVNGVVSKNAYCVLKGA